MASCEGKARNWYAGGLGPSAGTMAVVVLALAWRGGAVMAGREEHPRTKALSEVMTLMAKATSAGRTKTARKTRPVDARPATVGEIVVTMIKGEGQETKSRPAKEGDFVVRNRCPETGNEEYLVSADKFADRYKKTAAPLSSSVWQEFEPAGKDVRFILLEANEAPFSFVAPWGEPMVARAGDAIVQDPKDEKDVYRVARAAFDCTYEVVGRLDKPHE
jgi:hypothetical protein